MKRTLLALFVVSGLAVTPQVAVSAEDPGIVRFFMLEPHKCNMVSAGGAGSQNCGKSYDTCVDCCTAQLRYSECVSEVAKQKFIKICATACQFERPAEGSKKAQ